MLRNKKTKIVATISDKRCSEGFIRSLYEAGMDVVRLNSAHLTIEGAQKIVDAVRRVDASIPLMLDTKGPEIRVTALAADCGPELRFADGDTVRMRGTTSDEASTRELIYMNVGSIASDVPVGTRLLIADGELELTVTGKHDNELLCKFVRGGVLRSRKSVNIPGVAVDLPPVTDRDRRFIEWAVACGEVDFIAHSFVRTAADIAAVQQILDAARSRIKIISKIENREGIDRIDEIIEASYGVMVARGDMGVELPAEVIPTIQRMIVDRCIAAKRPVIIATQMLYSMVRSPRPTRAEVSDVAGAIYDRVDAVMLSDETAAGDYPVESVATMARVAQQIERDVRHFAPKIDIDMQSVSHKITAQVARAAVRACAVLPVKYVICDTLTGRTGRYIAAFRGLRRVVAICYTRHAQRILALSYGVVPILREQALDRYHFLIDALEYISRDEALTDEDLLVSVGGSFDPRRSATYMELGRVCDIRRRNEQLTEERARVEA